MKIRVESEKIIKAVKKIDGIEIVFENLNDAKEAVNLILARTGLFEEHKQGKFKQVKVTSFQKYETTAVDYKMIFLIEFIFKADASLDDKVAAIKALQDFFSKL
jgi:copper chaperone CopZ